jgi:hypothetical protein
MVTPPTCSAFPTLLAAQAAHLVAPLPRADEILGGAMGRRWGLLGAVMLTMAACPAAEAAKFLTPSRNISCSTGPDAGPRFAIECTVFSESDARRGQKVWAMRKRGRASVHWCICNAQVEDVPVLRYGRSYRGHGVRCVSRKRGLRCTNRTHRGFFLSRQRHGVF